MQNITEKSDKSLSMDKRVLITGASSGLGKELAFLFAKDKYKLVLVARSAEKLEKIASDISKNYDSEVQIIVQDLSENDAAITLYNMCQNLEIQIDILINNAGFAYWGEFYKQGEDSIREMLNLMILNTTLITSLFGKDMKEKATGKIVQISSTSAFQAGPYMSTYFASKSYLVLLSEAIQIENKHPKIQIICPGAFHSDFEQKANMQNVIFFNRAGLPDSKEMAQKVYRFIDSKGKIYIPGFMNKLIVFMLRFFPRTIVHKVVGRLLSKK